MAEYDAILDQFKILVTALHNKYDTQNMVPTQGQGIVRHTNSNIMK